MCESTQTTSASIARNVALPWVVLPLSRLPPLCLLPGHTPAHDARYLAEGNRVISSPISARIAASLQGSNAGNAHEQGHGLRHSGRGVARSPVAAAPRS